MDVDCSNTYNLLCDFTPRNHQKEVWKHLVDDEIIGVTLLSGTGSGKTESVLIPSLALDKRLIMVYPTRSLVEDQIERTKKYIRRMLLNNSANKKTLIIDYGNKKLAYQYRIFNCNTTFQLIKDQIKYWANLPNFKGVEIGGNNREIHKSGNIDKAIQEIQRIIDDKSKFEIIFNPGPRTLIEINNLEENMKLFVLKSRKHYYGGDVILTTLDKFIYRFFGYGEKKWNLLYPFRLLINPKELVVAFDEAHSYDLVAYTNFVRLISTLVINPKIRVVVMSATLPEGFIDYTKLKFNFSEVRGGDYKGKKTYELYEVNEQEARNKKIKGLIDSNLHKKIVVVRNTVKNAFDVYNELKPVKNDETGNYEYHKIPVFFYHGRLFDFIKSNRYMELKQFDEKNRPYILITTHAIEVGCDLSSDVLITDFCNPEQLIQRSGRCARKKDSEGIVYIIGTDFLGTSEEFMRENLIDYKTLVEILRKNNGKELQEDDLRKIIKHELAKDEITDALFGLIYSYVYDFDRTKAELHQSGMLVTRSWTPSANVILLKKEADMNEIRRIVSEKEKNVNGLVEWLGEKQWIYNTTPLQINLEYLSTQKDIEKEIYNSTFVVGVENSIDSSENGGYVNGNINPYLNDVYVFHKTTEYPNHNLYGFGLINIPNIFKTEKKDIIKRILIKKQIMSDDYKKWSGDVKIEYLDLMQTEYRGQEYKFYTLMKSVDHQMAEDILPTKQDLERLHRLYKPNKGDPHAPSNEEY